MGCTSAGVSADRDQGALLGDVVPQHALECSLQQVGSRVIAAGPPPQPLIHTSAHLQSASLLLSHQEANRSRR